MAASPQLTIDQLNGNIAKSKYLVKQLGFPEFGDLDSSDLQQMTQTVSCIQALLMSRQREIGQRTELFERLQAQDREKTNLTNELEAARDEIERLRTEVSKMSLTGKTLQQRWNEERKALIDERSRLLIDVKKLQSKDVQSQHEIKQMNTQVLRLKESLRKTLGEKDLTVKNPLEITNALQGSLGHLSSLGGFEEFSRIVVNGYNDLKGIKDELHKLDCERSELMEAVMAVLQTKQIKASTPCAAARHLLKLSEELATVINIDLKEQQHSLQYWKTMADHQSRLLSSLASAVEPQASEVGVPN